MPEMMGGGEQHAARFDIPGTPEAVVAMGGVRQGMLDLADWAANSAPNGGTWETANGRRLSLTLAPEEAAETPGAVMKVVAGMAGEASVHVNVHEDGSGHRTVTPYHGTADPNVARNYPDSVTSAGLFFETTGMGGDVVFQSDDLSTAPYLTEVIQGGAAVVSDVRGRVLEGNEAHLVERGPWETLSEAEREALVAKLRQQGQEGQQQE